jgi:hypothetical protein
MTGQRITGLLLIALGAFLLLVTQTGVGGEAVVLFIGVAFLVAYGVTREYGFLIPAGILTGLGIGIVAAAQEAPGQVVVLGLGLGFISITLVDHLVHGDRDAGWWPLVPGGILTAIGVLTLAAETAVARYVLPVLLVAAGVALLVRPRSRMETSTEDS